MRICIIGNDGITLCRETPATVNDGDIAVASQENCMPRRIAVSGCWHCGMLCPVAKAKKVGARGALIDQLWSAIEALPEWLIGEVAWHGVDRLQIVHETIPSRQSFTTASLGNRCPRAAGAV